MITEQGDPDSSPKFFTTTLHLNINSTSVLIEQEVHVAKDHVWTLYLMGLESRSFDFVLSFAWSLYMHNPK